VLSPGFHSASNPTHGGGTGTSVVPSSLASPRATLVARLNPSTSSIHHTRSAGTLGNGAYRDGFAAFGGVVGGASTARHRTTGRRWRLEKAKLFGGWRRLERRAC